MGEICCGVRVGPASARPPVKIVETKLVVPHEVTHEESSRLPEYIDLGVLDHVTAPQMVSIKIAIKTKG
jgi:hypothetical protein